MQLLQYHKGALLSGKISVNLIWYGKFKPSQKAIVSDFITSLSSSTPSKTHPSVAQWWKTTEKYYHLANSKKPLSLNLGKQVLIENYSLGKSRPENKSCNWHQRGEADAPLEAASACPGVYAKECPAMLEICWWTKLRVQATMRMVQMEGNTLIPALYDPSTSSCSTLV
ncbi:hypothetical protein HAX54_006823 [Datura stramonium]|uniref:Uncharacterized protein n=1 Tax=Datura stramonium TaxID=4076 RepID=A0ABS8RUT0_DATST|nr:hypothetical protein [Datura stramonium]